MGNLKGLPKLVNGPDLNQLCCGFKSFIYEGYIEKKTTKVFVSTMKKACNISIGDCPFLCVQFNEDNVVGWSTIIFNLY